MFVCAVTRSFLHSDVLWKVPNVSWALDGDCGELCDAFRRTGSVWRTGGEGGAACVWLTASDCLFSLWESDARYSMLIAVGRFSSVSNRIHESRWHQTVNDLPFVRCCVDCVRFVDLKSQLAAVLLSGFTVSPLFMTFLGSSFRRVVQMSRAERRWELDSFKDTRPHLHLFPDVF